MREFAFGADGASVGKHDVLGDGKAQARAAGLTGAGFVDAIETFEQPREMFRGDSGSKILHTKFYAMRNRTGAEDDSSAGSAVLECIVNQVREDLMDGFAVCQHRGKTFRHGQILNVKVNAVSAGDFPEALFGIVEEFSGRNGLHIETSFAGFDAGQSQQIFSEA